MNFKTLLCLSAFSLIGAINAAPVNSECQCHHRCQGYLLQFSEKSYTCLTPANFLSLKGKHCVNVKGFYSQETNVYCIDEENSTIDICNKSSEKFNYNECMRNIVSKGKENKINISIYREDLLEAESFCKKYYGTFLTSDDEKYVCLVKEGKESSYNDCVLISGDRPNPLCVINTNEKVCQRSFGNYEYHKCLKFLIEIGRQNHIVFEQLYIDKLHDQDKIKNLCNKKNGTFSNDSEGQYSCLIKQGNNEMNDMKETCELINGTFSNDSKGKYICTIRY